MRALFMALDVDNLWERKKNKNAGTTISVYSHPIRNWNFPEIFDRGNPDPRSPIPINFPKIQKSKW